jgi:Tol biopolymer transport system component
MVLPFIVTVSLVVEGCGMTPARSSAIPTLEPTPSGPDATTPPSLGPTSAASPASNVEGQIVFEDVGDNFVHTQIWIENADGSNVRKIVSDMFTDSAVSLSPDGSLVAFYQGYTDSLEAALADPSLAGAIMAVGVDGTGLHEVDTGVRAMRCDAGPEGTNAWSPDGHRLAFTRTCFESDGTFVGQGLWTINVDGTESNEVTHNTPKQPCPPPYDDCRHLEDHRASWSPGGGRLVFARIDTSVTPEKSAIFTIGVDGGNPHQVTPWKLDANDPDWSPDGTSIVFNSPAEAGGDQNIFAIRPDGSGLTQLTSGLSTYPNGGQGTYHPSWSPDGTEILFSHSPATGGFADLFVMNRDGSDLHVLAETELEENHAEWGNSLSPH